MRTYYLVWQPGDRFERVAMTDAQLAELVALFASQFDDWSIREVLLGVELGATPYEKFMRERKAEGC